MIYLVRSTKSEFVVLECDALRGADIQSPNGQAPQGHTNTRPGDQTTLETQQPHVAGRDPETTRVEPNEPLTNQVSHGSRAPTNQSRPGDHARHETQACDVAGRDPETTRVEPNQRLHNQNICGSRAPTNQSRPGDQSPSETQVHGVAGRDPETTRGEAQSSRDSRSTLGSRAQSPGSESQLRRDKNQHCSGSEPTNTGQPGESGSLMESKMPLTRRLPKSSDELDEWITSLSTADEIRTPFGCGGDKLVYRAMQAGATIRCCLPKRVKDCDGDEAFFQRLVALPDADWRLMRPIDARRLRIKILASVRLSIQTDRIRLSNRYKQYVQDLDLVESSPVGRAFETWADVTRGMHKAVKATEFEATKAVTQALKGDPVYEELLKPVRGIGPAVSGYLIGAILRADRFPTVQSLWHYAGLHVVIDDAGVGKAPARRRGQTQTWNPNLKRLCLGVIADLFIKLGGEYKDMYDARKQYELDRKPDMTKMHAHRRARRYMLKAFMKRLWTGWMKLEHDRSKVAAA